VGSSELEETLAGQLRLRGIAGYEREARFCPERRFRADFLFRAPACLIVEVMGGTWTGGRHVTGKGYQSDAEKQRCATLMGYRYFPCTAKDIKSGKCADDIETYLGYYGGGGTQHTGRATA
jgi:hypothetical protein